MIYLLLIPIAILLYYLAVRSRKTYRCPECGEEIETEHMETSRCNICGAPLKQIK